MLQKLKDYKKYIFCALVVIAIGLLFMPIMNCDDGTLSYKLSLFNFIVGKKVTLSSGHVYTAKPNIALIISYVSIIALGVANFLNIKKEIKPIIGLVSLGIAVLYLITILEIRCDYVTTISMDEKFIDFVGTYYILFIVGILLLIIGLFDAFAEASISEDKLKFIALYSLIILVIGLFLKVVVLDYKDTTISLTGKEAIFGVTLEKSTFGLKEFTRDINGMIAAGLYALSIIMLTVNLFKSHKIFQYVSLFSTIAVVFYITNFLTGGSALQTQANIIIKYNFLAKVLVISSVISLVTQVKMLVTGKGVNEIINIIIPALILIFLLTFYLKLCTVMVNTASYSYELESYTVIECLKANKLSDHHIYHTWLIGSYLTALVAFIGSFVASKFKRNGYLVLSFVLLVALVFGAFVPFNTFELVMEDDIYKVIMDRTIILGFISLLVACFVAFYTGYKLYEQKDA